MLWFLDVFGKIWRCQIWWVPAITSDYPRLNEVADCGETEDWIQNFPEDDLRDAVLDKLRPRMLRNAHFLFHLSDVYV